MSDKRHQPQPKTEDVHTNSTQNSHKPKLHHFINGKLRLDDHPNREDIISNISFQLKLATMRMQENEELILEQVEKKIDDAFYKLWCRECNDYFRLILRYQHRVKASGK